MSSTGWEATDFGIVCALICADVTAVLVPSVLPSFVVGIGPDDWSRTEAAPLIKCDWKAVATVKPGLRNGYPYDAITPIACEVWGRSPLQAQALWHQLLISIDKIAHGRANEPGQWTKLGGEIGTSGAKYVGTFGLRLGIFYAAHPTAKPTSADVSSALLVDAEGATEGLPLGP